MVVRLFSPWIGGAERQAQKLATKLIELGVEASVVTGWWFWGTARREVIGTVPIFRNFTCWGMFGVKGLRKFGGYLYMLSLFWYLFRQRHQYDIIHVHLLSYAAFPAVLTGRWFGKKTIIKIANSGLQSDIRRMQQNDMVPGQRQMLPVILGADRIIAINHEIMSELRQAGVPPERIVFTPNGVELNGHCKTDYSLEDKMIAVFVGRLHPNKGLDMLLPAFKHALEKRPELHWQLWLLGDGPFRAELETLAKVLGISEQVIFYGQVTDVSIYLDQADIFVLPSRAEGLSNALLEAMMHGLPCIASDIAGNRDLIKCNQTGLLVKVDDQLDLAEAMLRLADDQTLRQTIGQAARQIIEDNYSLDIIARKYIDLYHTLL